VETPPHLAYAISLAIGLLVLFLLRKEHFVMQSGTAGAAVVFTTGFIAAAFHDIVGFGLIMTSPLIMAIVTSLVPREELAD
jgi:hypothetical protein